MTKTKYKALLFFQGHRPGDEFDADLDEVAEQRAIDSGHIQKVSKPKKEEKADG